MLGERAVAEVRARIAEAADGGAPRDLLEIGSRLLLMLVVAAMRRRMIARPGWLVGVARGAGRDLPDPSDRPREAPANGDIHPLMIPPR